EKSGLTINDGSINLTNASELLFSLTNLTLFVGTGATVDSSGLVTTNATGFLVHNANLDLAIIGEDKAALGHRQWIGLAASIGSMTPLGLPSGFTFRINDLSVVDNIAAADNSRLNWKALVGQQGDKLALDKTQLANVTSDVALSVAG